MPILMPKLSATMEEGTVVAWHRRAGDMVTAGDVIVDVETDKATLGIEAPCSGCLGEPAVGTGESAAVGTLLIEIATDEDAFPETTAIQCKRDSAEDTKGDSESTNADTTESGELLRRAVPATDRSRQMRSSPAARRLAREANRSLLDIHGTGPGGRIVVADVAAVLAREGKRVVSDARSAAENEADRRRRAIAAEVIASRRDIPSFTLSRWIDLEAVLLHRQTADGRYTLTDYFLYATAAAISEVPTFRTVWDATVSRPETVSGIDIGLVVSTDDGLLIPILKGLDAVGLAACAVKRETAVRKVREGRLDASDSGRASISLSCMIREEIDSFDAIISPGQSAILAVGRLRESVVSHIGKIAIRRGCTVTASVDHRVMDGRTAARFLGYVTNVLETASFQI